jgi:hypothetical protein
VPGENIYLNFKGKIGSFVKALKLITISHEPLVPYSFIPYGLNTIINLISFLLS